VGAAAGCQQQRSVRHLLPCQCPSTAGCRAGLRMGLGQGVSVSGSPFQRALAICLIFQVRVVSAALADELTVSSMAVVAQTKQTGQSHLF